ncbi:MAG: response regulator, partial [Saprospiraceae bacterium]|nr:response regulator [Saprospiraceae bacterium]
MTNYLKWGGFCLLLPIQFVFAQSTTEVLLVDPTQEEIYPFSYFYFCETDRENIDDEYFLADIDTTCFSPYSPSAKYLADQYLTKISLRSTSSYAQEMILKFGKYDLLTTSVIIAEGKFLSIKKGGQFLKQSERDLREGNKTAISLKLLPNKTYEIFTLVKKHWTHFQEDLNFEPQLYTIKNWAEKEQKRSFTNGCFFGLMSLGFLFVLFFWLNSPRLEYFYYLLYLAAIFPGFICLENVGHTFIFPENVIAREFLGWIPVLGVCSFYILFIRYYIDTPKYFPWWDRMANVFIVGGILLMLFIVLVPISQYTFLYVYLRIPVLLTSLFATFSAIIFFVKKPSQLGFYLLLGTLLFLLVNGFHRANLHFQWINLGEINAMFMSFLLEFLVFAMGLAYKMRLVEQQKKWALQKQLLIEKEKKSLVEVDKTKSRFFANISHELRTPLSLILGPLNDFKEKQVWPETQEMEMMQRNAERLLQLIDQLLDLSRKEAGKMELSRQHLDIIDFLRSHLEIFQSRAAGKNINYTVTLPSSPIWLDFDPDKLEKIITNLLSNAFKFTPPDGQVAVSYESEVKEGQAFLILIVKDSGIGISIHEQERIFERFYQVEDVTSFSYEGTGIGLSLAQDFAELHDGYIEVKSRPGEGASFRLYMPVKASSLKMEEQKKVVMNSPVVPTSSQPVEEVDRPESDELPLVLLVEDNPDMQQFVSSRLERGYRLIIASDGKEGLKKAVEQVPDLIISDIMMPKMDGLNLSKALRENSMTSHIPLILLTARAGQDEKIKGLETGAVEYLSKPFNTKELLIRIQNLTQKAMAMRERFSRRVVQLEPDQIKVSSVDEKFLNQLTAFVDDQLDNPNLTVTQIASALALSRVQVHRKMK